MQKVKSVCKNRPTDEPDIEISSWDFKKKKL